MEEVVKMKLVRVRIPDSLQFSDLQLTRDADGMVSFDWSPIEQICTASALDVTDFRDGPEDNVAGLIIQWYQMQRQYGGPTDPVAEDIIAETRLEDERGSPSHTPGRA